MSGLEKPSNVRFVSYECRINYVEMDYMKLLMIKEAKWDDESQINWFINNSKWLASIHKSWLILTKDKTTLRSPTPTPSQVVNWNPDCSWMHFLSKCIQVNPDHLPWVSVSILNLCQGWDHTRSRWWSCIPLVILCRPRQILIYIHYLLVQLC